MYTPDEESLKNLRFQMVKQQIEGRGILKKEIIQAMQVVPRHWFVEPDQIAHAYEDSPVPIASGQTLSQPYMVGTVTSLLELEPEHRVLEIGAGSGYQTAILGLLVSEVVGLEYHANLAEGARQRMKDLKMRNVEIVYGDGKLGWLPRSPYDRILASCAVTHVPPAWEAQLKPGGYLVFPQVRGKDQILVRWQKGLSDWEKKEEFFSVRYVPLL